jgi:6-phosphofructokinase 1
VLRAVVKSAIQEYNWKVVGFMDGYRGLVENWTVELSENAVSGILVRGGTILGTNNRANPFAYTYDEQGNTVSPLDRSKTALLNLKKSEVDTLIIIGGDGTLTSAQKFHELGLPVVAIPKTIDNDLNATDVTFGFDTAFSIATEAVDRLHSTAESHHRIMVLETMGRYAGWIALRAGIAGGGDIILIPEIPYTIPQVVEAVQKRIARGKEFTIIVVSEGAKSKDGEMVVRARVEGSHDPIRLGGVSYKIADAVEKETGIESRVTILGHLQRGGTPTPFDRWLATRYGAMATRLIYEKRWGSMVALAGAKIQPVSIKEAIQNLKRVNPNHEEVQMARTIGVSFGD